jgi:hypothetical protein
LVWFIPNPRQLKGDPENIIHPTKELLIEFEITKVFFGEPQYEREELAPESWITSIAKEITAVDMIVSVDFTNLEELEFWRHGNITESSFDVGLEKLNFMPRISLP